MGQTCLSMFVATMTTTEFGGPESQATKDFMIDLGSIGDPSPKRIKAHEAKGGFRGRVG